MGGVEPSSGTPGEPSPRSGAARLLVAIVAIATATVFLPAAVAGLNATTMGAQAPDVPATRLPASPPGLAVGEPRALIEHVPQEVVDQATIVEDRAHPMAFPPTLEPTIRPGRQIVMDFPRGGGALCTMNFVYQVDDASGYTPGSHQPDLETGDYLIGTAGHCVLPTDLDDSTEDGYNPPEVSVCVFACVGSQTSSRYAQYAALGEVVYARQALDGEVLGQDYAFLKVPENLEGMIEPEVPVWSGPSDTRQEAALGEQVVTYGQGVGFGDAELDARTGISLGPDAIGPPGAWIALVPVMPGDSGGPLLSYVDPLVPHEPDARAVGDVTHSIGAAGLGVPGLAFGTLSEQGVGFTEEETGLAISLATHPTEKLTEAAS